MANVELATAYISLVPTMQGVQGKVAEALLPAGAEADKAGKSSGGMFAGAFGGALGAAAIGVAATGAAVAGAAVGLYKVGAVFDDVTDTIRVGTGASGAALDGLVGIAQQVGTEVPTSFEQAGSTVADLNTRLGLSGDTLSTVAQQYIQAGNILGETVDINTTTAAFSAFGIEGANVEGAMDTLFRVSQATGIGLNELASTVQTSAAPLQNLGFTFEDTAALAGSLDKAGLNTSQVMASMSKGLVTLAKSGEEPQAAFKRVTGELQGFVTAGDTAGALDLASKVFGTRGASQFVGALQSGKINLEDLTGAAGMTSDTILGLGKETADAAESWQLIKNKALLALEPMGTAVFNLAGQGLGFLNDRMDGVIEKVSTFGAGVAGLVGILATGDFKGPIFGLEEDSGFVNVLFNVRDAAKEVGGGFRAMFAAYKAGDGDITSAGFAGVMERIGMGAREVTGSIRAFFAAFKAGDGDITSSGLAGFMELLGGKARSIADQIGPLFGQIGAAIGPLIPQFFALFSSISPIQTIFQAIEPLLPQLLGVFGQLATVIGGALGTALTTLVPVFQQLQAVFISVFQQVLATALPVIVQLVTMLGQTFAQLIPVLVPIITQVAALAATLVSQLAPIFMQLVSTVLPMVVTILGSVLQAIGPLIGMIAGLLIPIIQALMPVVVTVFGVIANVIGSVMTIIMGIIQVVTGIISGNWAQVWSGILNIISGVFGLIVDLISGAIRLFISIIGAGLNIVVSTFTSIFNGIVSYLGTSWRSITDGAGRMLGDLVGFFGSIGGKIMGALGDIGSTLFNTGKNIIQGLIDGIGSMMGSIGRAVLNIVPEAIRGPFEQLLGIHSPSRVFRGYGVNIGQGLILGIGDMHSDIESAVNGMVTVPSSPAFGAVGSSGDLRTTGGFGSTFNIYETDDPIATAHSVSRRQSALAT